MAERVTLTPCVGPEALQGAEISPALDVFRPPAQQREALVKMAADPACCVSTAMDKHLLIGYAAFHPPSAIESWGDDKTGSIIELGAVEVDPAYRGQRLAERLLEVSFAGGRFDRTVVFATMYAWHYDTKRTGLSDFQYRRMLERLYRSVGMARMATSDPEVRSHAANALMVRVGPNCPEQVRAEFERLRTRPHGYG